jgi:hypothetical protein
MTRKHTTRFAFTNPRLMLSLFFCAVGVLLAVVALSIYPGSAQAERPNQNQAADKSGALTPEEANKMAQGIKPMVNRSSDGLVQVQRSNGVSMDLQGRFQNVVLAKKDASGNVSQSCVDNPESAAAFLQIDPSLLGVKQSTKQPADAQSANH